MNRNDVSRAQIIWLLEATALFTILNHSNLAEIDLLLLTIKKQFIIKKQKNTIYLGSEGLTYVVDDCACPVVLWQYIPNRNILVPQEDQGEQLKSTFYTV